jgi:hypothetical protein
LRTRSAMASTAVRRVAISSVSPVEPFPIL